MLHDAAQRLIIKHEGSDAHALMQSLFHDCLLRDLRPKTTKCYMERIHYLLTFLHSRDLSISEVNRQVMQEYILSLRSNVSVATINGRIRAYKRLWKHLIEEELWSDPDPMKGIRQLRSPKKLRPVIGPEEITKMIRSLNKKSFFGNRDLIALLLHWDCMCRSGELRNLRRGDINIPDRLMKVTGKGRERMVPLSIRTAKALSSYLTKWRSKYSGDYLICMTNGDQMTERRYHRMIKNIADSAGVSVTPHGIRHSAATWYVRQPGASLELLRVLLGHSGLNITTNYLHLTPEDLVSGYNTLSPGNAIRF